MEITCTAITVEYKLIIIAIYRLPDEDFAEFLLAGEAALKIVFAFNINFRREYSCRLEFCNVMRAFGLMQVMTEPSRVTNSTATCIDNIFTNVTEDFMLKRESFNLHISDHLAQQIKMRLDCVSQISSKKEGFSHRRVSKSLNTNFAVVSSLSQIVTQMHVTHFSIKHFYPILKKVFLQRK